MFVELHILQHFAPSNLNRDDTGAPKDCLFGGVRRARISSQCIKRAIRMYAQQANLLTEEQQAVRTKRLIGEITRQLVADGRSEETARGVATKLLQSIGINPMADTPERTEYLVFIGRDQIRKLVEIAQRHWDVLSAIENDPPAKEGQPSDRSRREQKKAARAAVPSNVKQEVESVFNSASTAVDLALFGRMIADLPHGRVDAACQVAHAISTHQVAIEFDYYTAVDDLLPQETTGADMIGTVEFNSACFYRYANVDLRQLERNLGGDRGLALDGLKAFLKAAIFAVPTGKQNSFAAHNPPSLVATVIRNHGLWSLANAFVQPVRPSDGRDLVQESIRALDRYWGKLTRMYGTDGISSLYVVTHEPEFVNALATKPGVRLETVKDLVKETINTVKTLSGAAS